MAEPVVSIVIPAMNEELRLPATLPAIDGYLAGLGEPYEILVVNDGSVDGTAAVAGAFRPRAGRLVLVNHERRRGKGAAVRTGVLHAAGDLIAFLDADLSAGPDALEAVLEPIRRGDGDVAIGSRYATGSVISVRQPPARRMMSKVFRALVWHLLPDIRDTQAGIKAFNRRAAQLLFPTLRTAGFAFDVELLVAARELRLRVREIPIVWRHEDLSKVQMVLGPVHMFLDLIRITVRHHFGGCAGARWIRTQRAPGPDSGPRAG